MRFFLPESLENGISIRTDSERVGVVVCLLTFVVTDNTYKWEATTPVHHTVTWLCQNDKKKSFSKTVLQNLGDTQNNENF